MVGERGVGVVVHPIWIGGEGLDDGQLGGLGLEVGDHYVVFFGSGGWEGWGCEDEAHVLSGCEADHEEEGCVDVWSQRAFRCWLRSWSWGRRWGGIGELRA